MCAQHIKNTTDYAAPRVCPGKLKAPTFGALQPVVVTYVNVLSFLGSPQLRTDTSSDSAASQTSGLNTAPLRVSPGQDNPIEPAPTNHPQGLFAFTLH